MDAMPVARVEEIESALCGIAEIRAARVVTNPGGTIAEVHILATAEKPPKQLVRDVESLLMALFGIPLDHKKVSIAQLGVASMPAAGGGAPEPPRVSRPKITSVNAAVAGLVSSAQVMLLIDGTEYIGRASGSASATARLRQVAEATLDSVSQWIGEAATFGLEDVTIVALGRASVAVACVTVVASGGEHTYSGSALVRQGENEAIVRATLDAINRRVGLLTTA